MGLTDHGLWLGGWGGAANRSYRLVLEINPAVQACRRMRLSANYLYVHVLWLNVPPRCGQGRRCGRFPRDRRIALDHFLSNQLPELHTMKKVSRPNTWEPTCHRPGQPVRSSHCCRRAWRVLHRMRYQVRARRITLFAACHRFPCPIGDRTASKHRLSWRWLYDKKRIRFWLLIWQLELSAHDD